MTISVRGSGSPSGWAFMLSDTPNVLNCRNSEYFNTEEDQEIGMESGVACMALKSRSSLATPDASTNFCRGTEPILNGC